NLEIEVKEFKNESYAACLSLEADLYGDIKEQHIVLSNKETSKNIASLPDLNAQSYSSNVKSIPVHKWGETFNDNIEDLRKARHISKDALFDSDIDLFVGDASCWFRQINSNIKDWDSLVNALKRDLNTPITTKNYGIN
ncbi:hypothetical protein WA026_004166, partial [Henosepilachna vigintioctopunctata]